ncbi:response regulator transcription factor [Altererythrobacter aquiaggeris]|uniref:response regulator transcription factor n=1 Tax=Aestuarierythrobacter aquiaggeris TaxID=1898396 RepID=UPI00301A2C52
MRICADTRKPVVMIQRTTLHIIDRSSRNRAELSRLAMSLGHHAEVYNDVAELIRHPPRGGIIIAHDDDAAGGISHILEDLAEAGVWLPLLAVHEQRAVHKVVMAIKAGALDYLPLPLDEDSLGASLTGTAEEAADRADARRRMIDARNRIENLSAREREVLDWLTKGSSNKDIAGMLKISPRTVEIHRSNMMNKLGAKHAAHAVRMSLDSRLGRSTGT